MFEREMMIILTTDQIITIVGIVVPAIVGVAGIFATVYLHYKSNRIVQDKPESPPYIPAAQPQARTSTPPKIERDSFIKNNIKRLIDIFNTNAKTIFIVLASILSLSSLVIFSPYILDGTRQAETKQDVKDDFKLAADFMNKKNYQKAMEYFQKAAANGSAEAMTNIGDLYRNALGVKQDSQKAMEWYEKAVTYGDDYAIYDIARLYLRYPSDERKAMEWYEKAIANNSALVTEAQEMFNIGRLYGAVKKDYKKTLEWYEKAGANGYAYAMGSLGVIYRDGRPGIKKDNKKALEYFQNEYVAQVGHPEPLKLDRGVG